MSRPIVLCVASLAVVAGSVGAGYAWGAHHGDDVAGSTGLGSSVVASRADSSAHGPADVMFVRMMIPHHEQAIEMAALARTRAASSVVKALAAQIQTAQRSEVTAMRRWLRAWGYVDTMRGPLGQMMMGDTVSSTDMSALGRLAGAAFDRRFLALMITHHEGALTMADREIRAGRNADVLALAATVDITQTAQIRQMEQLLGR